MSQVTLGRGLLATFALIAAASAPAGEPTREGIEFFERKIRPLLVENCHKCHGIDKPKAKLRLDSRAGILKGGDSGPAIVPGQAQKSRLIEAIHYLNADMQMPPKGKLPASAIADLTAWVKMGAPWAKQQVAKGTWQKSDFDLAQRKRDHWSWHSVRPQTRGSRSRNSPPCCRRVVPPAR